MGEGRSTKPEGSTHKDGHSEFEANQNRPAMAMLMARESLNQIAGSE